MNNAATKPKRRLSGSRGGIAGAVRRGGQTTPKKKGVPFRLPIKMKQMVPPRVLEDGYGMKGKSRWISEAIEGFTQDSSWCDQVIDGEAAAGNNSADIVYLDQDQRQALEAAMMNVITAWREQVKRGDRIDSDVEIMSISMASVIRSAITWRLFDLTTPKLTISDELDL